MNVILTMVSALTLVLTQMAVMFALVTLAIFWRMIFITVQVHCVSVEMILLAIFRYQ